jgi:hypothetical protein
MKRASMTASSSGAWIAATIGADWLWPGASIETAVSADNWRSNRLDICLCARMKPPSKRRVIGCFCL